MIFSFNHFFLSNADLFFTQLSNATHHFCFPESSIPQAGRNYFCPCCQFIRHYIIVLNSTISQLFDLASGQFAIPGRARNLTLSSLYTPMEACQKKNGHSWHFALVLFDQIRAILYRGDIFICSCRFISL